MHTAIYIVWAIIPIFFFILALWAKLEQVSNKSKRQNPGDFLRQGTFVLVCVFISLLIDHYLLNWAFEAFSPEWIPLGFYQIILLPLVLCIAASAFGPSRDLRIKKPTTPSSIKRSK